MIGRGRKRASWWVAVVLPGLLLRALIPVGFMPMFGPGLSVQLTLCEGYAPLPSMAMDMSMDMPMGVPAQHHSGGPGPGRNGPPSNQDHSSCPYGTSPTLASLPALTDVPVTVQASAPSLILDPQVAHFEIATRAQSPRGLPLEV